MLLEDASRGGRLNSQLRVNVDTAWVCPQCHSINPSRDSKCYKCRLPRSVPDLNPLVGDTSPPEQAVGSPTAPSVAPPPTPFLQPSMPTPAAGKRSASSSRFCASCGKTMPIGARFCSSCGAAAFDEAGSSSQQRSRVAFAGLGVIAIVGVAGVLVLVLSGLVGHTPALVPPNEHALHGTVTAPAGGDSTASTCLPWTAYLDLQGSKVTVTDQAGKIVGSSTLRAPSTGEMIPHASTGDSLTDALWTNSCVFIFDMPVSTDATFYTVTIGNHVGPTYSKADLESSNWSPTMGFGAQL